MEMKKIDENHQREVRYKQKNQLQTLVNTFFLQVFIILLYL